MKWPHLPFPLYNYLAERHSSRGLVEGTPDDLVRTSASLKSSIDYSVGNLVWTTYIDMFVCVCGTENLASSITKLKTGVEFQGC
jgi:hypothetical protein